MFRGGRIRRKKNAILPVFEHSKLPLIIVSLPYDSVYAPFIAIFSIAYPPLFCLLFIKAHVLDCIKLGKYQNERFRRTMSVRMTSIRSVQQSRKPPALPHRLGPAGPALRLRMCVRSFRRCLQVDIPARFPDKPKSAEYRLFALPQAISPDMREQSPRSRRRWVRFRKR
jgi:hypothetical protein